MEKVSDRKNRILEAIDEEIHALEEKLSKVQPLIDELNQLKRTRATLLSERTATGSVGARTRLNMESVVHALRENDNQPMTAVDIANSIGVDPTVVRSHLNRYKDQRYIKENGDGWTLIGEETSE
jgi:DNA-binding transcriptional ArsR family regulator